MHSAAHDLELTLEQIGEDIRRSFSSTYANTPFGVALKALAADRAWIQATPYPSAINKALDQFDQALTRIEDVPGYLDAIGAAVLRLSSKSSTFRVKVCRDHLFLEVQVAGKHVTPPFFHETKHSTRGTVDTLLLLAPTLLSLRTYPDKIANLLEWFELHVDATRVSGTATKGTFRIQPCINWTDSEPHAKRRLSCGEITLLMASVNMRRAVADVARTWHDPIGETTLICGAAGSGKELLKGMVFYALPGYKHQEIAGPMLAASPDLLRISLTSPSCVSRSRRTPPKPKTLLFVDEIHHQSAEAARTFLLRPLTARQLDLNTGEKIDLSDCRFLFAASRPRSEIRKEKPPDFWTRMKHTIEMKHPLLDLPHVQRAEVLTDCFRFFWQRHADKVIRKTTTSDTAAVKLLTKDFVDKFCDAFSKDFNSPLAGLISIRTIDAIVGQLYTRGLYRLRSEPTNDASDRAFSNDLEKWMPQICDDVVNEAERAAMF